MYIYIWPKGQKGQSALPVLTLLFWKLFLLYAKETESEYQFTNTQYVISFMNYCYILLYLWCHQLGLKLNGVLIALLWPF